MHYNSVITGTGSFIPSIRIKNSEFNSNTFFTEDGEYIKEPTEITINKFKSITDIKERRYAPNGVNCSDLGFEAAERAIVDSGVNREELDYIIVAHNFGDVPKGSIQSDTVPSIASRVKHHLQIKNPNCVAYDVLFGCPGWIEGVIQAHAFIKAGMANKCLVVGTEALSRVIDPHDRDSMIFADGAGAVIIEKLEETERRGILSHASLSYTFDELDYLFFDKSNCPIVTDKTKYIKMKGRKIYEFALTNVPKAMKSCLDLAKVDISNLNKVLIHQANHKMDEAIIKRFYKLQGSKNVPENIMPMTIGKLGNSSVATIPTLFDLILKDKLENHKVEKGDHLLFASVGAGMNINAFTYKS